MILSIEKIKFNNKLKVFGMVQPQVFRIDNKKKLLIRKSSNYIRSPLILKDYEDTFKKSNYCFDSTEELVETAIKKIEQEDIVLNFCLLPFNYADIRYRADIERDFKKKFLEQTFITRLRYRISTYKILRTEKTKGYKLSLMPGKASIYDSFVECGIGSNKNITKYCNIIKTNISKEQFIKTYLRKNFPYVKKYKGMNDNLIRCHNYY